MDLAKDIFNLAEKVARVPGLANACSLAVEVIKTVQINKNNTARLQYLAHFVTDHLVRISEVMQGRWDNAPAKVKEHLDESEAILQEVLRLVKKYSKSSRMMALVNAGDRQVDIKGLERRLRDVQISISFLVGLDTAVAVNEMRQIQLETHSAVLGLPNPSARAFITSGLSPTDEMELRTYTRSDVQLIRLISQGRHYLGRNHHMVIVNLYQADLSDNTAVLVKTYGSPDETETEQAFMNDLTAYKSIWDSRILQLMGSSRSVSKIPFQVYHAPRGNIEPFVDWYWRTLRCDPIETIFGLYDMRKSIRALLEFQRQRFVLFWDMLWLSLVNVQIRDDRHHWELVYSGELKSGSHLDSKYINRTISDGYLGLDYVGDPSLNKVETLVKTLAAGFSQSSPIWAEDDRELDAILKLNPDTTDLPALGAALFKNGLLGTCEAWLEVGEVVSGLGSLGLGDIGYMTNDGDFVVVDNFHARLTSTDGGLPTWETDTRDLQNKKLAWERSGTSYKRYEIPIDPDSPWYCHKYTLKYTNLDEQHAWEVLQDHAWKVTACRDLAIQPHELRLITGVGYLVEVEVQPLGRADANGSEEDCEGILADPGHGVLAQSASDHTTPPTVYFFEPDDPVHVRASGAPEPSPGIRASFQAEPAWPDDEKVWDASDVEVKGGFKLNYEIIHIKMYYLQLPVGVAHPYLTN